MYEETNDKLDNSTERLELKTFKNEQKISQYKQHIKNEIDQLDKKLQGLS